MLLSCFDPVRREIGRITLEMLIEDGRIHPHRIEEVYERSRRPRSSSCACGPARTRSPRSASPICTPSWSPLLGRLSFRTSYGQNVLGHLLESAHIAGMMAAELGIDPAVVKRGTLLHDIGKALTHEVEGSHALIGADLARRHGESEDVVHSIEAHHNEVEPRTIEAVLTQAADGIGGRPGVRRESLESYVRRLKRLEQIAAAHTGVAKVFAMQAGREIRVMVRPEDVDDIQAQVIARDVAKQVEEELTYPGQIGSRSSASPVPRSSPAEPARAGAGACRGPGGPRGRRPRHRAAGGLIQGRPPGTGPSVPAFRPTRAPGLHAPGPHAPGPERRRPPGPAASASGRRDRQARRGVRGGRGGRSP